MSKSVKCGLFLYPFNYSIHIRYVLFNVIVIFCEALNAVQLNFIVAGRM
jgi:hypothetical protein